MLTPELLHYFIKEMSLSERHIKKIFDESLTSMWLKFSDLVVYISLDPAMPYFGPAYDDLDRPPAPGGFVELLRKYLMGGKITTVEQPPGERLVTLTVEKFFPEEKRLVATRLVAELIPRKANLILVDEDGVILGVFKERRERNRELQVSALYIPPPPRLSSDREEEPQEFPPPEEVWKEFRQKQEEAFIQQKKEEVLRGLNKSRKKVLNQIDKLEKDLKGADRAAEFQRKGELLKVNMGQVKRGMEKVTVIDYYEEGCPEVEISLDPLLKPVANVEKFFKKYKKLVRAKEILEERMEIQREKLREVEEKIAQLEDPDTLYQTLKKMGKLKRKMPKKKVKKGKAQEPPQEFRRFISHDGWVILVGRRARENDKLTMHVAKGNDFFFHVNNYPGSHVIVLNQDRLDHLPQETLLDGATLAVYYSKMRDQSRAEVSYTQKKFIKKHKKAPPGQVQLTQQKNILIDVEEERLKRLLESGGEAKKGEEK